MLKPLWCPILYDDGHIHHHDREEMVILSDFETDEAGEFVKTKWGKKKRELIGYEDSDDPSIIPMRKDLEAYNELHLLTHIDIRSLEKHNAYKKGSKHIMNWVVT